MASTMTRFEIQIPLTDNLTQQVAIDTFLDSIGTLAPFTYNVQYVYRNHNLGTGQYTALIYGLITTAQQVTALGFLNTLNTTLGIPVLCTASGVTTQP